MINSSDLAGLQIRPASFNDIQVIQQVAEATWPVAYSHILSRDQLRYMLNLFYSTAALQKQMDENQHFFLAFQQFEPIGFAAFTQQEKQVFKLQKLYVLPTIQKSGAGKALLRWVEEAVKNKGGKRLLLNVNRNNNALNFYQKHGFSIIEEVDVNIGSGYFMNDFVMEKRFED